MKAINFKEANKVLAEGNEEYQDLPALANKNGLVLCCFQMSESETKRVRDDRHVVLLFMTGDRMVQPVKATTLKPDIPLRHQDHKFKLRAEYGDGVAFMKFPISMLLNIDQFMRERKLWVLIQTYGVFLNPIYPKILNGTDVQG